MTAGLPSGAVEETLQARYAAEALGGGAFATVSGAAEVERDLARAARIGRPPTDPLAGRAIAVKDNIHIAGLPTTAATPALGGYAPRLDATVVARLRARGMVVIGKANLHELALGVTSTHSATGAVANPVQPGRVAGGSSGGNAAIIAAGVCRYGIGSDTGGSTRIPAVCTDTWGFRPSTGRYPEDGAVNIAFSRDTAGPMAADLASLRRLDAVLAEELVGATTARSAGGAHRAPLRIGFDAADLDRCDAAVAAGASAAVARLAAAPDVRLVPVDLSALDRAVGAFEPDLGLHELAPSLRSFLAGDDRLPALEAVLERAVDPHVRHLLASSIEATAGGAWTARLHTLLNDCARARSACLALLGRHRVDAVLRPALPILPPLAEESAGFALAQRHELFDRMTTFTRLATVVGSPSLALPLGPLLGHSGVGLLLDGAPGRDTELLAAAARVERVLAAG
jgi:mandelamide amidase